MLAPNIITHQWANRKSGFDSISIIELVRFEKIKDGFYSAKYTIEVCRGITKIHENTINMGVTRVATQKVSERMLKLLRGLSEYNFSDSSFEGSEYIYIHANGDKEIIQLSQYSWFESSYIFIPKDKIGRKYDIQVPSKDGICKCTLTAALSALKKGRKKVKAQAKAAQL